MPAAGGRRVRWSRSGLLPPLLPLLLLLLLLLHLPAHSLASSNNTYSSFETGFDTWNVSGFLRLSGSTPTSSTGPNNAYNGSYYVYAEVSSPNYPGVVYSMHRNFGDDVAAVSFHYHMYGSQMGALELQGSDDGGSTFTTLWSKSGNQGNAWRYVGISIDSEYPQWLQFVYTSGSGKKGDMALDGVQVLAGRWPSPQPTTSLVPTTSQRPTTASPTAAPTAAHYDVSDFSELSNAITTNAQITVLNNITFTDTLTISGKTNVAIKSNIGAFFTSDQSFSATTGGLVHIEGDSNVTLSGLGFASGTATYGGCLAIDGNSVVEMFDLEMKSCSANYGGGMALLSEGSSRLSTITAHRISFSSCSAGRKGGGFFVQYSTAWLEAASFMSCESEAGGAMYLDSSTMTMVDLSLRGNSAEGGTDIYNDKTEYSCTTSCGKGQAGNCSELADSSDAYDCYVNCGNCLACPSGTAYNGTGSASSSDCSACPPGYVSQAGAAACLACEKGRFATDNSGLFGVITKATHCRACDAGYIQSAQAAVFCIPCNAGQSTNEITAAVECTACVSGSYASTGSASCTPCAAGYYQPANGSSACLKCSTELGQGYWSREGSAECSLAAESFFMNTQRTKHAPESCPEGVICRDAGTTTESMLLEDGWFKFVRESTGVYLCPYEENCKTPAVNASGAVGQSLCTEGSGGPLCSVCDRGYYLHTPPGSPGAACIACSEGKAWLGPVIVFGVAVVLGAALLVGKAKLQTFVARNRAWLSNLQERAFVFLVAMQILTALKNHHDTLENSKSMAEPYNSYLSVMSVVDLDIAPILPLNCMSGSPMNHEDLLLISTLMPLGLGVILVLLSRTQFKEAVSGWIQLFLRVLLLAYPAISRTICRSFRCSHYDDGTDLGVSFLTHDLGIKCSGERYLFMFAYATVSLVVYSIGIPTVMWLNLYRERHELNPPGYEDEGRAILARQKFTEINPLVAGFAMRFRPSQWYYEVISLTKRFAFTCAVLAFPTLESFTVFVLTVSVCGMMLDREWAPYIDVGLSTFNHVLNLQVVLLVIYTLLVDAEMIRGEYSVVVSVGLMIGSLLLIAAMVRAALTGIKQERVKEKELDVLHAQLLKDKQEDRKKFAKEWAVLIETGDEGDEGRLLHTLDELARRSALPNGKQPRPRQEGRIANVDELLVQASEVGPVFHKVLRELVKEYDGYYLQGPNKTRARAVEKIESEYFGDQTLLVDVVRGSAIFLTLVELTNFVKALQAEDCLLIVVRAKDRFNKPLDSGYRDMLLNVQLASSAHVCELQLHIQSIIDVKESAHRTYALMRSVGWQDDTLEDEEDCGMTDEGGAYVERWREAVRRISLVTGGRVAAKREKADSKIIPAIAGKDASGRDESDDGATSALDKEDEGRAAVAATTLPTDGQIRLAPAQIVLAKRAAAKLRRLAALKEEHRLRETNEHTESRRLEELEGVSLDLDEQEALANYPEALEVEGVFPKLNGTRNERASRKGKGEQKDRKKKSSKKKRKRRRLSKEEGVADSGGGVREADEDGGPWDASGSESTALQN